MQHRRCIVALMEHPVSLPHILIDRCLGEEVPRLLRKKGMQVTTLREIYGKKASQTVTDAEWLSLAGDRNWISFTKDFGIFHNDDEYQVLNEKKVCCFCLWPSEHMAPEQIADTFLANLEAINLACQEPAPAFYVVNSDGIYQPVREAESEGDRS